MRCLEPEDFKRALAALEDQPKVLHAVLFAALTGLRWGEQVALRIEEDVDFRRNRLRISRALYRRTAQTPKTPASVGDVEMCPTVRRLLQAVPWREGYVFSPDGRTPIGDGSWIKRQWRKAQIRAGIRRPISWHDLRHQFVSLLIASGRHPKYIAKQARHASAGFTLDRYGELFETIPITSVEWWDDLLWPQGCPYVPWTQFGHTDDAVGAETRVLSASALVEAAGIEPAS
ncbi:MAG: site-specific integrase [Armatimonadota bacterium]|nr:site-specific integrase [Armatimonadota bacterium]